MKYSYIINFRKSTQERYINLLSVLRWIEDFDNIEIILVEQDSNPHLQETTILEDYNIKYKFIYNDEYFNRSWGFNVGAKVASNETLIFSDADLIIDENQLVGGVKKVREGFKCVSPYDNVIDLTQNETLRGSINIWNTINRQNRGGINLTGGLIIFDKDAFYEMGGWCEDFKGWGGEDDFMTWKVKSFKLKSLEMSGKIFHLFHERAFIDQRRYNENLKILQKIRNGNSYQLLMDEKNNKQNIGDEYKYRKKENIINERK